MATFGDLNQYLNPDLTLPIGGREYTISAPSATEGLRMKAKVLGDDPMSDFEETRMAVGLLGGKWDAKKEAWVGAKGSVMADMLTHVDWDSIYRAAKTALIYFTLSRDLAETFWQTGDLIDLSAVEADPTTVQQT